MVKKSYEKKTKIKIRRKSPGGAKDKLVIISDIHANREALEAVLNDIKQRTDVKEILCAGDVVGYGPDPAACCELVRKLKIPVVQGNHDANIDLSNLGWFNWMAQQALVWTSQNVGQENREWLMNLPKKFEKKILGKKVAMVHGSPRDPVYEYVTHDTPNDVLRHFLNMTKADVLIMGHTHIPFVVKIGKRLILNPGAVGQPRDGDPDACYAVVDMKNLKAEIVRVEYNIQACAEKIYRTNIPNYLADRLFDGV